MGLRYTESFNDLASLTLSDFNSSEVSHVYSMAQKAIDKALLFEDINAIEDWLYEAKERA